MPELPEVEAVARALRPLVEGCRIRRCRVIHSIAVRPSSGRGAKQAAAAMERVVRGQKIRGVSRRGKYLILILESGAVVLHFRLDGQLVWFDSRETSGHIDVAFELDRGTLGFVDRRHFGRVQWIESPEALPGIARMGIEPLSPEFTAARFAQLLRASQRPLKLFLLDQDKIAGIGNIYSSEAMWRARIHPRRRANRVNAAEARRLYKAIVDVLHRALECCSNPAPDFRDPQWWFQGLESILRVYGREGKSCRRCGEPVRRIEQGGRSTFFCAHCQR
ncbi:MAG TPA: DNA-formamidopyrimidine glycosylase [Candidatus Acidoferrales bacterium]|nr:DNA-formamidopyrimidine glycosylase [Candidatus Acidoferrales bacterium]